MAPGQSAQANPYMVITKKKSKNANAQLKFEEGQNTFSEEHYGAAVEAYRQAIELDPDFFPAHQAYILASVFDAMAKEDSKILLPGQSKGMQKSRAMTPGGGPATEHLLAAYEAWARKYPSKAVFEWGLGKTLMGKNNELAEKHFQQAVQLDPKFVPAYQGLAWIMTYIKKDPETGRKFRKKAAALEPDNPDYALDYAQSLEGTDAALYKKALEDVVARFPNESSAKYALYSLLKIAQDDQERTSVLERMWQGFADDRSTSFCWIMKDLFGLYASNHPDKALVLARDMLRAFPEDAEWKAYVPVQEKMVDAQAAIKAGNFEQAKALLAKLKLAPGMDGTPYYLLRAEALGKGEPAKAYDSLLDVAVPDHNAALNSALVQLGKKLSKTPAQVEDELWQRRLSRSVPFKEFELVDYRTGKPVKVSDYRGKVVLVNFWFPGCGPCLAEFPYVQQALTKYGPQGFVVLAINTMPKEDEKVVPLLTERKFSFVPLKMPKEGWAQENYGVTGTPANFLLDAGGAGDLQAAYP
jgi:thiol-disulfide isomerase/thioredoxin/cytochrome c-type biogenesis protein CcmH/NrfG